MFWKICKGCYWTISKIMTMLLFVAWSIWGLLGALPGGSFLRIGIAVTLLYQTYIVHGIAWWLGFDMTPVDAAVTVFWETVKNPPCIPIPFIKECG